MADIVAWRRANQPGGSNAGSVFVNPAGDSAGRLVESAGLKGLRMGTAQVSTKHANFIQADKGGLADDVWRLVEHVRTEVAARTGVVLVPEVRMVGFPGPLPTVRATSARCQPGCVLQTLYLNLYWRSRVMTEVRGSPVAGVVGLARRSLAIGAASGPGTGPEAAAAPGPRLPPGPGADAVVHPRVWQRRVAVLRDQGRRRLRWVVAGVAALVALCVALLALHTPLLALRHATVVGAAAHRHRRRAPGGRPRRPPAADRRGPQERGPAGGSDCPGWPTPTSSGTGPTA